MVGSIDGAGNGTFEGVGVEGFGDGTEFGNIEGTFDGIFDGLTVDVGFEGNDGEAVGSQSTSTTVEHSLE